MFYDRRFDCAPGAQNERAYRLKLDYPSPHSMALDAVPAGARALDLGCAGGHMGAALKERKSCELTGVDVYPLPAGVVLDAFHQHDLNNGLPTVDIADFDYILLLDVIEHLAESQRLSSCNCAMP